MMKWEWILIIVGVVWISLLAGIWTISQNWDMLAAISTWVLAAGIFVAIWQIRETKRSTNAQLAVELLKDLRDRNTIEMLDGIYQLEPDEFGPCDFENLPDDQKRKLEQDIDYVIYRFELLAALVARRIIDRKLAIENYAGIPALRCWYRLHNYLKDLRDKRGYYGDNYEDFTNCSLDHFNKLSNKKYITVKLCRRGEEEGIDLLSALQDQGRKPKTLKANYKEKKLKQEAKSNPQSSS